MLSLWVETDGHGRPVELADGTELEWSADGELLSVTAPGGAETQFGYDGFGRLVEVTLADGRIGRYRYDALGRRSAVRLDGQLVRRFVYGGAKFPRARVDADGDVLERYVYAGAAHVPDLIVRRDGQRLRLITDSLGSVRAVVDIDTGTVVQRLAYDAYGRVTQDTAPGTQPFGYKGAATDPVLEGAGLVWMGVRAYLPAIGRFTTVDSAGLAAGWNEHDGLAGDPVNLIDPDGRYSSGVRESFLPLERMVTNLRDQAAAAFDNWTCLGFCETDIARRTLNVDPNSSAYGGAAMLAGCLFPGPGGKGRAAAKAADALFDYGSKIAKQLGKRGWDDDLLKRAIASPAHTSEAVNKSTGGPATAYFLDDGSYVVVDDASKSVLQVSNRHDPGWIPDSSIKNPYRR